MLGHAGWWEPSTALGCVNLCQSPWVAARSRSLRLPATPHSGLTVLNRPYGLTSPELRLRARGNSRKLRGSAGTHPLSPGSSAPRNALQEA